MPNSCRADRMVEATATPPAGQDRVPTPAASEHGEPAKLISERAPLRDAISHKRAQPLAPGDPTPKRDGYPYVAPLRELCVEAVARDFVRDPRAIREPGLLDAKCVKKIVDVLPVDLPLELAGELVADEDYWQRRSTVRWENPETVHHGRSWKQLYFELNLQEAIEAHVAKTSTGETETDPARDALRRLLVFSKQWARSLKIVHAPGAVDVASVFECTGGSLVSLDLTYIARNVEFNYDGANTVGMRLGCARALSRALEHAETLTHLGLSQNSIDDPKMNLLASGLAENNSVTSLDLARNRIGDGGATAVARVLAKDRCVVSRLDLGDNEIGADGAEALARALEVSSSLTSLSLRLNPKIGDEAGAAVLDAVTDSSCTCLRELDVAACGLGPKSAAALARLLRANRGHLRSVDASGNEGLGAGATGGSVADALYGLNDAVLHFDVRGSGFSDDDAARIIDKTLDNAEAEETREEQKTGDSAGRIFRPDFLQDIAQS